MNASIPRACFDKEHIEMSTRIAADDRVLPSEANENLQIAKFLLYLHEGPRRGRSFWMHLEAELRAVSSERQPNVSDCAVLHPANRKKDLS